MSSGSVSETLSWPRASWCQRGQPMGDKLSPVGGVIGGILTERGYITDDEGVVSRVSALVRAGRDW